MVEPTPSVVRKRVLAGHQALREQLLLLRRECADIAARPDGREALRLRAESVGVALEAQIELEDHVLSPILEETPGFGDVRAEELAHHHAEQRRLYDELLDLLRSEERSDFLPCACDLLDRLRRELVWEDRELLDPNVVKDDPIDISLGS